MADILSAATRKRDALRKVRVPDHGVTTVFVDLPNTRIELLQPLGGQSPIARFLDANPSGGG